MIRITVAEGLKRMYKEYRLKQWQMLLDKAARLRRLLEQQEREEGQNNEPLAIENQPRIQEQPHANIERLQPTATSSGLRSHETQHDWQRAAPEAYDWYPVTDYRTRADSSGARNQTASFHDSNTAANSTTNGTRDSNSLSTMVPLRVEQNPEVSANNSLMEFEASEANVTGSQDNSVQQTVSQDQQQETVSDNHSTVNRLHPDISEMVEAMEAIFQDSDDDLQNLTSPIPRPQWNMTSSPARAVNLNETSSPAGTGRALEGISQAGMLGEIMNENSPARRRLLWCDDPPNPADDPPVLLYRSGPNPYVHPDLNLRTDDEGRLVPTNHEETAQDSNQETQEDTEQPDQQDPELESSFQSYVSWDSSADSNDIDSLGGILFAAERLGPMDQSMHMDIEMGDMGLGHLLFDRAAGTWATSHCEFHRVN